MSFFSWLRGERKKPESHADEPEVIARSSLFSTTGLSRLPTATREEMFSDIMKRNFQRPLPKAYANAVAMDSTDIPQVGAFGNYQAVSDAQLLFFGAQTFPGYRVLAILAQHWLIEKACRLPAEDAVRNGFEVVVNDGAQKIPPEVFDEIVAANKRLKLADNLVEFVRLGRVFGIRVMLFEVESSDPDYYKKPFNIDGVKPGSYKGMSQIDPYWMTPEFDWKAMSDPAAQDFYEPTWWSINGKLYHRSHLAIYRPNQVADILKPTYFYGGVSVPQKIMERVYAAERTANEAPQLAMTKRLKVLKTDITQALANEQEFTSTMEWQARQRDNYGTNVIGLEDTVEQHDTSLADLDAVIMTQYQLVASAADVPADKLLGTAPKGFNTTGEYQESSYHEFLMTIQAAVTPAVERHIALVVKSEVLPNHSELQAFVAAVEWEELDAPTAKEAAEIRKIDAETDAALVNAGGIDGADVRDRLIRDPQSGYSGLAPREEGEPDPDEGGDLDSIINEIMAKAGASE